MPHIRPVSDLRNRFNEISKLVHETSEPVFLTKNGTGDMVVMSLETFDEMRLNGEIFLKLKEAEQQAQNPSLRFSHEEAFSILREKIAKANQTDA